jgi:hypothetical protein
MQISIWGQEDLDAICTTPEDKTFVYTGNQEDEEVMEI